MTTCNISIGRVFDGSSSRDVYEANRLAQEEGYGYFIFGDVLYITKNPIWFSPDLSKSRFSPSDLVVE